MIRLSDPSRELGVPNLLRVFSEAHAEKTIRRALLALALGTLVLAVAGLALFFVARQVLKPASGAWAINVRIGPVTVQSSWAGRTTAKR